MLLVSYEIIANDELSKKLLLSHIAHKLRNTCNCQPGSDYMLMFKLPSSDLEPLGFTKIQESSILLKLISEQ